MSLDFQFAAAGVRPSWLTTTASDDVPLNAPSDDLAPPSFTDFMTWDPNASQGPDLKLSGPACPLKPELQRPPIFDRRQHSSFATQGANPPSTATMSGPTHNAAYTFGENTELPPSFDFDVHNLSSPSNNGQQHESFYPSHTWG